MTAAARPLQSQSTFDVPCNMTMDWHGAVSFGWTTKHDLDLHLCKTKQQSAARGTFTLMRFWNASANRMSSMRVNKCFWRFPRS